MGYLEEYAEPEAAIAETFLPNRGPWQTAVVVPAIAEEEMLKDCLESLDRATKKPTLAILVVNARDDHSAAWHASNQKVLSTFAAWQGTKLSLAIVDRASEGKRFPEKQGVGLARKIGGDIALALHKKGMIVDDIVHTTDADARVTDEYFDAPTENAAAYYHLYEHVLHDDEMALYELYLRYYVEAMRFAESPYAFPTIGSTIAYRLGTYEKVRGFPRKLAGEDFYFLGKASKVGPIRKAPGLVKLSARRSRRVPFGTGASLCKMDETGQLCFFYDPKLFEWMREWMRQMNGLVVDEPKLQSMTSEVFVRTLRELGAFERFERSRSERPDPQDRRRHLHEWFDAFRVMKLVHIVRDAELPSLSYREMMARATFLPQSLWCDSLVKSVETWRDHGLGG